jgi:hypothetical protein
MSPCVEHLMGYQKVPRPQEAQDRAIRSRTSRPLRLPLRAGQVRCLSLQTLEHEVPGRLKWLGCGYEQLKQR